jgi:hypothetical protein
MVKRTPCDPLEAAIDHLGAISPKDEAERAIIEQTIVGLVRIRSGRNARVRKTRVDGKLVPVSTPTTAQPVTAQQPLSERSPFYGLGLQLAAPKQLQIAGVPQAPREIWAALAAAGFQSAHQDPPAAVRNALKRRMTTHADVFLVGDGKWARKDFYTEEQLVEIKKSIGGMGGRDRVEHSESTKAGMIVARRRGVRLGAPKWFTDEREAEFIRRFKAGETVAEIAAGWDKTANMIRRHFPKAELKRLRQEAESERRDADAEDTRPGLRLVR